MHSRDLGIFVGEKELAARENRVRRESGRLEGKVEFFEKREALFAKRNCDMLEIERGKAE